MGSDSKSRRFQLLALILLLAVFGGAVSFNYPALVSYFSGKGRGRAPAVVQAWSEADNTIDDLTAAGETVAGETADALLPYTEFPHSSLYDPDQAALFAVGITVVFEGMPPVGHRQRIVGKFELSGGKDPAGWAVGFRRLPTTIRPEFYWRYNSQGGWLTFPEIEVSATTPETLLFIARVGSYLAAFRKIERDGGVAFEPLGTISLRDMPAPHSESPLLVWQKSRASQKDFKGSVSQVLLLRDFPFEESPEEVQSLFADKIFAGKPLSEIEELPPQTVVLSSGFNQ